MTVQQRRLLGVVGGLAVLVALVLVLTSGGGGGGDQRLAVEGRAENAPSTTTSTTATSEESTVTTVPLVPVTTGVPIPDATEAPPTTARPTASPAAPRTTVAPGAGGGVDAAGAGGSTVTAAGAVLTRSPSGATRSVDKAKGCNSAVGEGWKLQDCGALRTSGTVLLWVVETKGRTARVVVLKEQTSGIWAVVLSAVDTNGATFGRIGVRADDVSGDGQPELVFGFHRRDAASTLAMDVVDAGPAVVVHRELPQGSAQVAKGQLTTWAAAADGFDRVVLRFSGGAWRAGAPERVARSAVPASMI